MQGGSFGAACRARSEDPAYARMQPEEATTKARRYEDRARRRPEFLAFSVNKF
jgi:hypothetical protein